MAQKTASGIRIVVIKGSVRPGNFTSKAAALVVDELQKTRIETLVVDPATLDLPAPGLPDNDDSQRLKELVASSTGVILATPEYHGSVSSVLKGVIENLGFPSVLAGKPVGLLGVAAGQIGAIKTLEQLRSICSHIGAIVLPGPVSVANVQRLFDDQGRCLDEQMEQRIRGVATSLVQYIRDTMCPKIALEQMVREQATAS